MNIFTPSKLERDYIVVIGKESTGKSHTLSIVTVDARYLTADRKDFILASLQEPQLFPAQWIPAIAGWHIQPQPTLLEHSRLGWLVAIAAVIFSLLLAWGGLLIK